MLLSSFFNHERTKAIHATIHKWLGRLYMLCGEIVHPLAFSRFSQPSSSYTVANVRCDSSVYSRYPITTRSDPFDCEALSLMFFKEDNSQVITNDIILMPSETQMVWSRCEEDYITHRILTHLSMH